MSRNLPSRNLTERREYVQESNVKDIYVQEPHIRHIMPRNLRYWTYISRNLT